MNGSQVRVSIVTPSYNQACFLEETLRSVECQDYPGIEHIVIDGGSTDGSVDIIRRHANRLTTWVSGPDDGQSDAIRKGFSKATGSVLAWLNSDDLLLPGAVRIAVEELARDASLGLVYGDRLEIDAKGNIVGEVRLPAHRHSMFSRNFTIPQETAFFRRTCYDEVGGVDARLHFAMDFDFWVRLSRVTAMRHVPHFLGCYRRHDGSKSIEVAATDRGRRYAEEAEAVYLRHFGRALPSAAMMAFHRGVRHARVALDRNRPAGRREGARLLAELKRT